MQARPDKALAIGGGVLAAEGGWSCPLEGANVPGKNCSKEEGRGRSICRCNFTKGGSPAINGGGPTGSQGRPVEGLRGTMQTGVERRREDYKRVPQEPRAQRGRGFSTRRKRGVKVHTERRWQAISRRA